MDLHPDFLFNWHCSRVSSPVHTSRFNASRPRRVRNAGSVGQRPGILESLRAAGGPPRARKEALILTLVGLSCAFASSAAFFLHVFGVMRMPFFINFIGMPAIVLMLVVGL